MKTLLVATHNAAKLEELKIGLDKLLHKGIKIVLLSDLEIKNNPEETGTTFEGNAKIKAEYYAKLTGLPTLADDGGIMIQSLNNEPGVKSRRWLGYEASDQELINHTLKQLENCPLEKRVAYLKTCVYYHNPITNYSCFEIEKIKGYISEKTSGRPTKGYPFRALFIIEKFDKYYDELTDEEHLQINHRLKALKRLITKIEKDLLE